MVFGSNVWTNAAPLGLGSLGYSACYTHVAPLGLKTKCAPHVFWRIQGIPLPDNAFSAKEIRLFFLKLTSMVRLETAPTGPGKTRNYRKI